MFLGWLSGKKEEAKIWIMKNQIGRRNISVYLGGEYQITISDYEASKQKQKLNLKQYRSEDDKCNSRSFHVLDDISSCLHVSKKTASRIIQIHEKASEEQKGRLRSGDASINEV